MRYYYSRLCYASYNFNIDILNTGNDNFINEKFDISYEDAITCHAQKKYPIV